MGYFGCKIEYTDQEDPYLYHMVVQCKKKHPDEPSGAMTLEYFKCAHSAREEAKKMAIERKGSLRLEAQGGQKFTAQPSHTVRCNKDQEKVTLSGGKVQCLDKDEGLHDWFDFVYDSAPVDGSAPKWTCKDHIYRPPAKPACFPGSATVQVREGLHDGSAVARKRMDELETGDLVSVADPTTGVPSFSPLFIFHHKDESSSAEFVRLDTASGHTLELSKDHYIHKAAEDQTDRTAGERGLKLKDAVMVKAEEIRVGDLVFVQGGGEEALEALEASAVLSTSLVNREGVFAPGTLTGTLLVDGVAASTYSRWVFEEILEGLVPSGWFHAMHHGFHLPFRWLWRALGPERARDVSMRVQAKLDEMEETSDVSVYGANAKDQSWWTSVRVLGRVFDLSFKSLF